MHCTLQADSLCMYIHALKVHTCIKSTSMHAYIMQVQTVSELYIYIYSFRSESVSKTIFPQIATQILQKPVVDLRCSSRAWKVNLIGEGADDAGGVFDETMAQMCEVRNATH